MTDTEANELKNKFDKAGQGHVFRYLEELSEADQSCLLKQSATIDPEELQSLIEEHLYSTEDQSKQLSLKDLHPAPYIRLPESGGDPAEWQSAYEAGAKAISAGKVAAFTVAGGQGT